MVEEIRIYLEGGGNEDDTKADLRRGFSEFFKDVVSLVKQKKINWKVIPCGARGKTYRNFSFALRDNPKAFNILLVDSEGPISQNQKKWEYLCNRPGDGWKKPQKATEEQCHFMVQMMEAWFVADINALKSFYGQGFSANSIPKNQNVELIGKSVLEKALKAATKKTKTKGEYHKTRHAPEILKQLNVQKVRAAAYHCDRLLKTLEDKIGEA